MQTSIQEGTAAGPRATPLVVILLKPKVGTKINMTNVQNDNPFLESGAFKVVS